MTLRRSFFQALVASVASIFCIKPASANVAEVMMYHGKTKLFFVNNGLVRKEFPNGAKQWFQDGRQHRDDGPAIERIDGGKEWVRYGNAHRIDGPAVESPSSTEWWVNGRRHRIDGPAVVRPDGHMEWWVNGERHRVGGPAVIRDEGYEEEWWENGKRICLAKRQRRV